VDKGGSFPGTTAAGPCSWPLTYPESRLGQCAMNLYNVSVPDALTVRVPAAFTFSMPAAYTVSVQETFIMLVCQPQL
jgi:hypothetical protein